MLFAQKDNEVFNLVLPMDVMHNELIVMAAGLSKQKVELGERIKPDKAQGMVVNGLMSQEQWLALRPRMIDLNSLIENMRSSAKRGAEESWVALDRLSKLLRDKLSVTSKVESTFKMAAGSA